MPTGNPTAEAARWFVDLITATDIDPLWSEFEDWLQQDQKNRAAYDEMERTWSALYSTRAVWARKTTSEA